MRALKHTAKPLIVAGKAGNDLIRYHKTSGAKTLPQKSNMMKHVYHASEIECRQCTYKPGSMEWEKKYMQIAILRASPLTQSSPRGAIKSSLLSYNSASLTNSLIIVPYTLTSIADCNAKIFLYMVDWSVKTSVLVHDWRKWPKMSFRSTETFHEIPLRSSHLPFMLETIRALTVLLLFRSTSPDRYNKQASTK